jgi:hypothetical protein
MAKIKDLFKKHKNLSLFIALIFALGLTYLFEEKRNKDIELEQNQKLAVLDIKTFGELKSFKGIKLNIKKVGEKYYSIDPELKLSDARLGEFIKILTGLKIKSVLDDKDVSKIDRSFYIPNNDLKLTFTFEKGQLEFSLGKKLDYDQAFYMEVIKNNQKKMMVVNDESPDPTAYQNEEEYKKSDFKYKRLQMLFYLTNVFFYETKVFNQFNYQESRINFKQIEVATFRNKKFTLDFEHSATIPKVLDGMGYFEDNWISFHRVLTSLEAKTVYYPFDSAKLGEPLSILNVIDREGVKYSLELYKKYGSLPGYFLKTSFDKILYDLRPDDAKYFFVNIQDFWHKRIYPDEKEFKFNLSFPKQTKTIYSVEVKDKEIFEAQIQDRKVRASEIKKLIDFLKMESDNVQDMTENPSELVKKEVLKLYFANRELGVILEDNDVVLVDYKNKLKFHHYVGMNIPFSLNENDYLEK